MHAHKTPILRQFGACQSFQMPLSSLKFGRKLRKILIVDWQHRSDQILYYSKNRLDVGAKICLFFWPHEPPPIARGTMK